MAKTELTLEDLADGRYKTEPVKGKKKPVVNWTLNSRHLMVHLFFNVLKEPHRGKKTELPSIDEAALQKMKNPIAKALAQYRKDAKTLASVNNALSYVISNQNFTGASSPTGLKAVVQFNPMGFDGVERIFTKAQESIPINVDKRVRKAFVTSRPSLTTEEVGVDNLLYIRKEEFIEFPPVALDGVKVEEK